MTENEKNLGELAMSGVFAAHELLAKVIAPDYRMGELPVEKVPEEFAFLRAVADCIWGLGFYEGQPKRNIKNALKVIEFVRNDLDQAEEDLCRALGRSELE